MVKMYIYECELENGNKIVKKNLKDFCECINNDIEEYDYNGGKYINSGNFYNYFNRNKYPSFITKLERFEIKDYFDNELKEKYGEDIYDRICIQNVNRRLRQIYNKLDSASNGTK